jgi:hypothetical protein
MGDMNDYYALNVGYNKFIIDKRYTNLKPCGDGSYGFVASADDSVTGMVAYMYVQIHLYIYEYE